jgi:hypothetical protein
MAEKVHFDAGPTHFVMRTISKDMGIFCKTELVPYRAVLKMSNLPTYSGVPYLPPEHMERIPFTPDVWQWLNTTIATTAAELRRSSAFLQPYRTLDKSLIHPTALAATGMETTTSTYVQPSWYNYKSSPKLTGVGKTPAAAIAEMKSKQAKFEKAFLTGGLRYNSVLTKLNATSAPYQKAQGMLPEVSTLSLRLPSCYFLYYVNVSRAGYPDSCVSTETDKVFSAYLATVVRTRTNGTPHVLPSLPNFGDLGLAMAPAIRQHDTGTMTSTVSANASGTWEWGPMAALSVPNRLAHIFLVVVTALTVALLLLLHWLTLPHTALAVGVPVPTAYRDGTPWMVLAEVQHPPEALRGLADLGIDKVVRHEGTIGTVLGLVPVGSVPNSVGVLPRVHSHTLGSDPHWLFKVVQGWLSPSRVDQAAQEPEHIASAV